MRIKKLKLNRESIYPPEGGEIVPDGSKPVTPRLTPSEIESLRKHKKLVLTSLRGRFAHLFEE